MSDRRIPIDGTYNFRDTGGLPLAGGGVSRAGVLFRSDALSGLTEQGETQFSDTPVGVIVDFRTEQERKAAPDKIPTTRPFQSINLSILAGSMSDMASEFFASHGTPSHAEMQAALAQVPSLGEMYVSMLEAGAAPFAEVARLIIASTDDAPTAVLVHCTAGKDRTGVATALMLDAAGVEREAIVSDYASSQEHLAGPWAEGMLHMAGSFGIPVTPALRTLICGTPPEAIQQALKWIDDTHGSTADYLASGGFTSDELAQLRARLTESAS